MKSLRNSLTRLKIENQTLNEKLQMREKEIAERTVKLSTHQEKCEDTASQHSTEVKTDSTEVRTRTGFNEERQLTKTDYKKPDT